MRNLVGLFVFLSLFACGDDQADIDEMILTDYIAQNNLDAERTPEGIYVIIEEPGSSEKPRSSSIVDACYKGYTLDGVGFDSSYVGDVCLEPLNFPLTAVIDGWQIAIPLFGRGGKGTILIPSRLAYGSTGQGPIGPDTILAFDIHVIDFK